MVLAAQVYAQEAAPWVSRFTGKHVFNEGVGHDDGFTTLEWFLPLNQDSESEMWFGDFRGIMFDDAEFGGNLGMGFRKYNANHDRIYGVNAYWDFRDESSLLFNQAGIGVETLGRIFDFRVNGYTPTVNDASQRFAITFLGHNFLNNEYHALSGLDYEAAVNLPNLGPFRTRVAGGGYFFDSSNTEAANGWRARLEVAFRDSIAASVAVQEDDLFGQTVNFIVEIRRTVEHTDALARRSMHHKFRREDGGGDGRSVAHRLADPVYRQQNIVLRKTQTPGTDISGTPLTFLHVVEGGVGNGTFEMPFGTITDAMTDPLAPTSVVFTPQGGSFTENVTLVSGTRLLSNGPVQSVASSMGPIQLPFSGVGADLNALPASIIGDVVLANNTELSGFDITGGVSGSGIMTANVNQTAINMSPADALSFSGSDDITIDRVAISMPTGRGILLSDSSATLRNVTIENAGDDGIEIETAGSDRMVTISNTAIAGTVSEGVDVNVTGAGDLELMISDSQISSTNNAVDITTTGAGNAFVNADTLTLASITGAGFNANGSGGTGGTLFVNSFSDNAVTSAMAGGVIFDTVSFDGDTAVLGLQSLSSDTLTVGSAPSRVNGVGLSLTNVTGDWNTGIASIFNQNGPGFLVDNSVLGTPVLLSSATESIVDTVMGPAIDLDTVTSGLVFDSITTTDSPGVGIDITAVSGMLTSGAATSTGSVLSSVRYENIPLPRPLTTTFGTRMFSSTIQIPGGTSGLTQN